MTMCSTTLARVWVLQVRITGGMQQLLPGFLAPLFGQTVALDKLVIDDERHIMYSLNANSSIQVGVWWSVVRMLD